MQFFKQEAVFTVSLILAVVSCFFELPNAAYIDYIDFHVLSLLFCLMTVIGGFSGIGLFSRLGELLLSKVHSMRTLLFVLVSLCFFSSMFITNDVALITFVPFTILILQMVDRGDKLIFLIVLETIAANLGSMLTPLGNPQNLYLYTISGMRLTEFISVLLPYTLFSFVLLILVILIGKNEPVAIRFVENKENADVASIPKKKLFVYTALFLLCLLVVLHIVHFALAFGIVLISVLLIDRKVLREVDYTLLLTFVCFFVFIGNMKNIPAVHGLLSQIISGHEFASGVLASQFISNVPAAVLLSGFTSELSPLLIGVNLGGLGTLIASLASLISYKFYVKTPGAKTGRYLLVFTAYNMLFLAVLTLAFLCIGNT
ncbi:MAG: citrate transporter [Lachnospiraceae bacterium]|nr:citrate transporter [Lachnospiraceae bacterium]